MKAKNLSKVLAFLVAAVMIFSALPLMAFATDEATTYTVSFGAPAIPMDVDTKVDLKTLNVEMVKGEAAVSGADITWAADAQDGLTLDAVNKTVKVTAVGNYKLTATVDGGTPKNIWVIAKPANEEKIYLVNMPNISDTIAGGKWRIFGNKNSTDITVAAAIDSGKLSSDKLDGMNFIQMVSAFGELKSDGSGKDSNAGATLVYVDEIFEDFSDYTVESYCTAKGTTAAISDIGAGVGGRVVLNQAGTAYTTGVLSYIRTTEQVSFCRPYEMKNKWGEWGGYGPKLTTYTFWATNTERFVTVKTKLEDSDIMVYFNRGAGAGDEARLDSTSNHPYTNQAVTAGYPCLTGYGAITRFANFYVYLNSNDMPATMTDEPEAPAPTAKITIVSGVGTGTAKVDAVVGSENTYTVTLEPADGYKVKVGSLVINGKPAVDKDSTDPTGLKYTFTTDDLANTTIAVEYIVDDGKLNTAMLGATIPTNPEVKGIRFGARTDSIKRSTKDATKGLLNDTINVDGEDYTITDIGMILFPTKPLGDAELTVATDGVVRQSVSKIVALTDGYADIAITLTGIPETMVEVQITSRMYVAYTDAKGATQYVYSNAISKSYDDVVKAIPQ